jgi:hypothetical protein
LTSSPRDLNRFLRRFLADREQGAVLPLDAYQAAFPGNEDQIAEEYARLAAGQSDGGAAPEGVVTPAQTVGPYRILRVLGRGGQGTVHLAEDTRLPRRVALKILTAMSFLSDDAFARFRREAEVACRLDHPGLCTVYDFGQDQGIPYIAMRFVEGETLAARIASESVQEGRAEHVDVASDLDPDPRDRANRVADRRRGAGAPRGSRSRGPAPRPQAGKRDGHALR